MLADVVPGISDVEILTEGNTPIVHLVFETHSVPAALAGDGVHSLLRIVLELASRQGGVVLLEEPEVHKHPAGIRQTAKAILSAMRRGIQIFVTTHSLELIDGLVAESSIQDLQKLSLYRLQLQAGILRYSRLPGPDVAFARGEIEEDLR
jgi:predicted ATPase